MINDANMECKKLQLTAKLRVAQEINSAQTLGISPSEARDQAIEDIRSELDYCQKDIVI